MVVHLCAVGDCVRLYVCSGAGRCLPGNTVRALDTVDILAESNLCSGHVSMHARVPVYLYRATTDDASKGLAGSLLNTTVYTIACN
jgi:hypothetical protein